MLKDINEIYKSILIDLYTHGQTVKPRGLECKEIQGYQVKLEDITSNVITIPGFETNLAYAKEELAWYLSGSSSIAWSEKINRIWSKYSSDGFTVNSNYGERIFGKHKLIKNNQWEQVKEELKHDPDSRRAIINLNSYFDKDDINSKDVPCTIAFQLFIRDRAGKKLDWVTYMRSNDINKGFRNDVYCFTEFQKKMALELSVNNGNYYHIVGSMHLYSHDYQKVEKLLKEFEKK